jgi:hypothetical protein
MEADVRNILKIHSDTHLPQPSIALKVLRDLAVERIASVDMASGTASQRVEACNTGCLMWPWSMVQGTARESEVWSLELEAFNARSGTSAGSIPHPT